MVLKKASNSKKLVTKPEVKKTKSSTSKDKLSNYSDDYKPLFPPMRFLIRECPSFKDPTSMMKDYLELKVTRYGEDGLPFVFLSMYRESDFYTGYCKGKTVYFPLEMLYTVMEKLDEFSEKYDNHHIE